MSVAHGPTVAIMLSFMPDDLLGVRFYPNAANALEKVNYIPGKKISMITGQELGDHEALGQPGTPGFAFEVQSDSLNTVDVSFVAKKDANSWIGTVQANGLSMIHEPGYEMVLAALRKICETPPTPEKTTKRTRVR